MSDRISKARRDFGRFNFSELTAAGWLLLLGSFAAMIAAGYFAFSFVDKEQAKSRLSENAAAAICVGSGIAFYLGGRFLLSAVGISTRTAAPEAKAGVEQGEAAALHFRRRYQRSRFWFWAWLAFIPLGVGVPALLLTLLSPRPVKQFSDLLLASSNKEQLCLIAACLLPFVGLAGVFWMGSNWSRYKRAWLIAEFAARLHLNFVEEPEDKDYEWLARFQSLNARAAILGANLARGSFEQFEVMVLDLNAQQPSMTAKSVTNQTVFVVQDGVGGVADFALRKRAKGFGFSNRSSPPAGAEFDRGEFDKQFEVTVPDPAAASFYMDDEVAALCHSASDCAVEVHRGSLIVFRPNTLLGPERYPDLLSHTAELARALLEAKRVP
jgi:hypothetical protein